MEQVKLNGDKLKSTIRGESNINMRYEREYAMYGFSWPQRSYKCTFCKKEFKSAQALGGHMNVHRRDRARLRQSSPSWDCPINPNPNNPKFSLSSSSSSSSSSLSSSSFSLSASSSLSPAVRFLPYPTNYNFSLTSLTLTSPADQEIVPLITHPGCDYVGPHLGDVRKKLSMRSSAPSTCVDAAAGDDHFKDISPQENKVRKDQLRLQGMEMDVGLFIDAKEGLDLELRLGQSN